MIEIKDATFNDFALFTPHADNIAEMNAMCDYEPGLIMALLWEHSEHKKAVFDGDKLLCLTGIIDSNKVWLYFSAGIYKLPLSFFKTSRLFVANLLTEHGMIEGYIYSKNKFSLDWARFIGFTIEDAAPQGAKGKLFHYFYAKGDSANVRN